MEVMSRWQFDRLIDELKSIQVGMALIGLSIIGLAIAVFAVMGQ
jgi:hypothetical protein